MVAEHGRRGIRTPARVHDRPRRVQQTARGQADHPEPSDRRRQLAEHGRRDEAERDVNGREQPLGGVDPQQLEYDAAERAGPQHDQDHVGERPFQGEQRDRRVRARDQHEDHGMVEPAHPAPRRRAPGDAVVQGARAEQRGHRARVDAGGHAGAPARGGEDQPGAAWHRDEERVLVKHAAEPRLDRLELRRR